MRIIVERTLLRGLGAAVACLVAATACSAQDTREGRAAETVPKGCGTCHKPQRGLKIRRSKAQWQDTIDKMVAFGAKATDVEFASVLNYLSTEFGPDGTGAPAGGSRRAGQPASAAAGPDDKHVVDAAAADRGRSIWAA